MADALSLLALLLIYPAAVLGVAITGPHSAYEIRANRESYRQ